MRDRIENLKLFVAEHKAYFKAKIASDVDFNWEDDSWGVATSHKGVFSGRVSGHLEFKKISQLKKGIYLNGDTPIDTSHEINIEYRNFMKSFIIFLIKLNNHKISISALHRDNLLLKRIYIRMLINGDRSPNVYTISDEIISQAMRAHCSVMSNINNIADSQTAVKRICEYITRIGITFNPIVFKITQRCPSSKSTSAAKQAKIKAYHGSEFAEQTDEDESKKIITIQTFLNIVAVRSMVKTDGEKLLLNMLLLLMVTGFRFGELERLKIDCLKKLEVEDVDALAILKKKGLKHYYLGIVYIGEKKAGHRTHWVEPLAIDLVESIFEDTIKITKSVRAHIARCRENNFISLLPLELLGKPEISLNEIVLYISESFAKTAKARGTASQRDYAKKSLSQLGVEPSRVERVNGRQKNFYYSRDSIEKFLKEKIFVTKGLNQDFIYRFVDSRTGNQITYRIEDLLFIAPEGSFSLAHASVIKPLPVPVSMVNMLTFVGSKSGHGVSLFKKYNLVDENGEFPVLTTHMPRHTINTFLAIAGITDHLQAVMMGRVDITQNDAYQHLAIEQRALASEVVSACNQLDLFTDERAPAPKGIAASNALNIIKETAEIYINPNLNLRNSITQNTHSFTTKEDKISFIEDAFGSCSFDLMAGLSEACALEGSESERNALLERHADLHPLDFGSCMRKLQAWSCPYSMKCQDGTLCPYFTIIGRADDTQKLEQRISMLQQNIQEIKRLLHIGELTQNEYDEIIVDFHYRKENLQWFKQQSGMIESAKKKVSLIGFDVQKKPKTLATIFAIEHKKLEIM
ncbi:hypothetical protein [Tolumonas lignilytica]|uniref:hypothetical protein n=1 Tax=Tolumonas lignilytica TaxID=1283284 RepID=UPI000465AA4C|nr:hypothetical protein [Tolumonas lignilytica]